MSDTTLMKDSAKSVKIAQKTESNMKFLKTILTIFLLLGIASASLATDLLNKKEKLMNNTALIIVDFQNDYFSSFEGARWPLVGTEKAANNAAQILQQFRIKNLPVIHIQHVAPEQAPFFTPNSEGVKIHETVAPLADETVIVKTQANSFRDTNLKEVLDKQNIKNLIVVGAMTHNCIDSTVRGAVDLGYKCTVAHDACATKDMEFAGEVISAKSVHYAFMSSFAFAFAKVLSTKEIVSGLE